MTIAVYCFWLSALLTDTVPHVAVAGDSKAFPAIRVDDQLVRYPLHGQTIEELREQIAVHTAKATGAGHTRSEFDVRSSLEPDGEFCRLTAMQVSVKVITTLPLWTSEDRVATGLRKRWAQSLAKLEAHEQGHRTHAVTAATALRTQLLALPVHRDCVELQRVIDRTMRRGVLALDLRDQSYDQRTRHGLGALTAARTHGHRRMADSANVRPWKAFGRP